MDSSVFVSVFAIFIFFIYNSHLSSGQQCLGGSGTQIPEHCDIVMQSTNKCTSFQDIYPDPLNCRASFSCPGGPRQIYECPNGFIYNSWTKTCELEPENVTDICEGRRADCRTHDALLGTYIKPFPSNPAYYADCFLPASLNDTTVRVLYDIYKCRYEYLQEMVVIPNTFQGCRFACREKGFFQNPSYCNQYVYCTGPKAVPTVLSCAVNYVYDGTQCTTDKTKCKYP